MGRPGGRFAIVGEVHSPIVEQLLRDVSLVFQLGAAKVDMPTQQLTNELTFCGEDPAEGVETIRDEALYDEAYEMLCLVAV